MESLHSLLLKQNYFPFTPQSFQRKCSDLLLSNIDLDHFICDKKTPGCLFCLRLDEDSKFLATTTAECIQIWDPHSGSLLKSLKEHTEIVTSFVWLHKKGHINSSLSENSFFTSSLDKTIKFWRNFKPVLTLKEHADWIRCLGLSNDNRNLLSGCVSAVIFGWDVDTGKVLFKIPNAHQSPSCPELNTINSLQFGNVNPCIFVSGARDGTIKIWDTRMNLETCNFAVEAHAGKVNSVMFNTNDSLLLSGGRDNCIRLWDVRKLSQTPVPIQVGKSGLIQEYKKHKCSGYNVSCSFFNDEKNIVTGSEDKKVYIYDLQSGKVAKTLEGHPSVVHLIHCAEQEPLKLVSSSIESCSVLVWSPQNKEKNNVKQFKLEKQMTPSNEDDIFMDTHRAAVETLMRKHGDQILKIFHKFNFTFSSPLDWQSFLSDNDGVNQSDSSDLYQMINEMAADFAKALEIEQQRAQHSTNHAENEEIILEDEEDEVEKN